MDESIACLGDKTIFLDITHKMWLWASQDGQKKQREEQIWSYCAWINLVYSMSFKLKNLPGTFQFVTDFVWPKVHLKYALAYLDDIIIFLKTWQQISESWNPCWLCFAMLGLTSDWCASSSQLLSTIWARTFTYDNRPCYDTPSMRFRTWESLTNITTFQSFLALCNAFQFFVPNAVRIVAPLRRKMQED